MSSNRPGKPVGAESQPAKRKKYGDYLTCTVMDARSKWVTDFIVRDRRICLRGIPVAISQNGKSCHLDPVIPALSSLIKLLTKHPLWADMTWSEKTRKWRPTANAER